jgi:hypothetical protein
MKIRVLAAHFLTSILAVGAMAGVAQAQTGVAIEGAAFKLAHQRISRQYDLSGVVSAVTNYTYFDVPDTYVKFGLSKKRLTARGNVNAFTLATTALGTLPARSRITNIPFNGQGKLPKGTFYPILVVVDDSNSILAAATTKKRFAVKFTSGATTARRLSRLLSSVKAVPVSGLYEQVE